MVTNGGSNPLSECFLAIKKDINDNFNSNKCEDVVKRALIDSPVFLKCVEEELKKLEIEYKV